MAANGGIIRGIYTGEEEPEGTVVFEDGEEVPIRLPHVTHFSVDEAMTVIPRRAFCYHPTIVELICNDSVRTIERQAFYRCPSLERLIMPGVEEVENRAFCGCETVREIDCDKLEIIRGVAFNGVSMFYMDLPSAKRVELGAFSNCKVLRYVKFGKSLESFGEWVFFNCRALERITIPLKNGLIEHDNVFTECEMLNRVDLIEAAKIQRTTSALFMDEWRQDMSNVIDSINQILPNAPAGDYTYDDDGGKARAIREWIALVLRKIKDYKAQHRRLLNEASSILQIDLPNDIVHNNVLAFLELPSHTFDGEDEDNDSMVLS